MECPVCPGTRLEMTTRESIEIDYCPNCRGVWLDRGELDKVVERSMQSAAPSDRHESRRHEHDDDDDDYRRRHPGKRRRGMLGDLFDF